MAKLKRAVNLWKEITALTIQGCFLRRRVIWSIIGGAILFGGRRPGLIARLQQLRSLDRIAGVKGQLMPRGIAWFFVQEGTQMEQPIFSLTGKVALVIRTMAVELAPHGITVNAVAPTFIETSATAPLFADPAFRADALRRLPVGRLGQPEDVTGAVLFLASDAASLITGTTMMVDGGYTAI